MCGIVGYIGNAPASPILLEALKKLEYRGYDSSGLALLDDGNLAVYKSKGYITELEAQLPETTATMGVAHTRWATHGEPSYLNAHPHFSYDDRLALIHNGIIDNYLTLREELTAEGIVFRSETDTEVLSHLVAKLYDGDLAKAVRAALERVEGSYAIAVIHSDCPDEIVVCRHESPLILGLGEGENYVASDVPALLKFTRQVVYLRDGDMAVVRRDGVRVFDRVGRRYNYKVETITWSEEAAEKGGYKHFMLKEIFEQPRAVQDSLLPRLTESPLEGMDLRWRIGQISIVACGTSYHAGLTGKYIIEQLTAIPVTLHHASEFRYASPVQNVGGLLSSRPLVLLISQSGETADTLAAARTARQQGCQTVGICNVTGSSLTRIVDGLLLTRAGPEIGVAASKTFTTQMLALYLLAVHLAHNMGRLDPPQLHRWEQEFRRIPALIRATLDRHEEIKALAHMFTKAHSIFFIGRNLHYPLALEGALKLKEISYLHAEGYPAGELKHGPLALLSPETPVVAIAIPDHTYSKLISNVEEVSARRAPVIVVAQEQDHDAEKYADAVIRVPQSDPLLAPFPVGVALQLLAYYVADALGCEIDKPRNLAKSVTVE